MHLTRVACKLLTPILVGLVKAEVSANYEVRLPWQPCVMISRRLTATDDSPPNLAGRVTAYIKILMDGSPP